MRSIPMDKALDPDTIVATEMNGSPLTPEHGYPARALVSGWIGSASIKWLTEIRVLTRELEGYYMDSAYRLPTRSREAVGENYFDTARPCACGEGTLVLYGPGNRIVVTTEKQTVRFLLVAGRPLKERIAWYGPIVMNTQEELRTAFREYEQGTFVKHARR